MAKVAKKLHESNILIERAICSLKNSKKKNVNSRVVCLTAFYFRSCLLAQSAHIHDSEGFAETTHQNRNLKLDLKRKLTYSETLLAYLL